MSDALASELVRHAYLEGDFLLRSGKRSRYYLDKYRVETRPELLRPRRVLTGVARRWMRIRASMRVSPWL